MNAHSKAKAKDGGSSPCARASFLKPLERLVRSCRLRTASSSAGNRFAVALQAIPRQDSAAAVAIRGPNEDVSPRKELQHNAC